MNDTFFLKEKQKHLFNPIEKYVNYNLPFNHRSAFTTCRCGVAPIKNKTWRYEILLLSNRTCFNCSTFIENV